MFRRFGVVLVISAMALGAAAQPASAQTQINCGAAGTFTIEGPLQPQGPSALLLAGTTSVLVPLTTAIDGQVVFERAATAMDVNALDEVFCSFVSPSGRLFEITGVITPPA
jgi:hypothetical protein